jgi:hypothetical protein
MCRSVFISKTNLKKKLKKDATTLVQYIENIENKKTVENIFLKQFFNPKQKYECLQNIIYLHFNFTDIVLENLDNSVLFWDLILHNVHIDWYKTFNGWHFSNLVHTKTKDQNVIFFVTSKFN